MAIELRSSRQVNAPFVGRRLQQCNFIDGDGRNSLPSFRTQTSHVVAGAVRGVPGLVALGDSWVLPDSLCELVVSRPLIPHVGAERDACVAHRARVRE